MRLVARAHCPQTVVMRGADTRVFDSRPTGGCGGPKVVKLCPRWITKTLKGGSVKPLRKRKHLVKSVTNFIEAWPERTVLKMMTDAEHAD